MRDFSALNNKYIFLGQAFQPEFAEPLTNLTIPIGRNATFRCLVHNLGGYRVSCESDIHTFLIA